ncbi:hypothetical protein CRU92_08610 [Arcobacter sp. FW59]|nr:hypothetical protein CRU92_08610 [Arcobacter sp. FW59]
MIKKLILSLGLLATLSFSAILNDGLIAYIRYDYKSALPIFEELASKGNAEAQFYLGNMYSNGYGVKQDYKKAFEWYKKSANQGELDAQNDLGIMYANGQGVKQDKKIAKKWFGKACDGGVQLACDNYKILNQQGY